MAVIGNDALTLTDWAQRKDPDGKVAMIIELLAQTNPILQDMLAIEGNLPTGHRTTMRTGLPTVAWRMLNYGVAQSKSRTVQVTDTAGMLEAYSNVDMDLLSLNDNSSSFRASEDLAFLEAMNQEIASTLFYGNTETDPTKFMGLSPRYDSLTGAENSANVIDGGSVDTATNTSIWLIRWGSQTAHAFFPKGSTAGLSHRDLGEHTAVDGDDGQYQVMRTHFKWNIGFSLRDWRSCVRIANIDLVNDAELDATSPNLIDLITQAIELPHGGGMGTPIIYCNPLLRSWLRRQISNKSNVNLNLENYMGKKVVTFDGIPVRACDALINAEAVVS